MRPIHELIDDIEPAWPLVLDWINAADVKVEILPVDESHAKTAILATQVTTRSPMGAIVYHSAGILIDHGWLRILGAGGHPRMRRSLPEWNQDRSDGYYLIADDVVGGSFAINGGALGDDRGSIYYFAPDSLDWEPCEMGYSQFVVWSMTANLAEFYETLRWENWQSEVAILTGNQSLSIYPFLFTSGPPIGDRSRRAVPVAEQFDLQFDLKRQLDSQ